jgi:hypothetical protein
MPNTMSELRADMDKLPAEARREMFNQAVRTLRGLRFSVTELLGVDDVLGQRPDLTLDQATAVLERHEICPAPEKQLLGLREAAEELYPRDRRADDQDPPGDMPEWGDVLI